MAGNVYTLLCERDIQMALVTLPAILKFLSNEQLLIIVDDGSFTEATIDKLTNLSAQIKVITLGEREEFVLDAVGKYPHCQRYRKEFPLAFKLLDIPLIARTENRRFTFTDSDIIYTKNCNAYFTRTVNTYLRTDAIKLSVKLKDVFLKYKWNVPFKFNSGYFSYDTDAYDLDFIEYYLSLPDVRNSPWLSEQTCWALLFGRASPSYFPNEKQFVCRENFSRPVGQTLAIHLIGNLKNKYREWSVPDTANTSSAETPEFYLSRNVTLLDWVNKTMHRLVR